MDRSTRTLGLIVFALGILILLFVFATSLWLFMGPAERIWGTSTLTLSLGGLGSVALLMLARVGLLFIMALTGSMITGRGIELYFGCRARKGEDSH